MAERNRRQRTEPAADGARDSAPPDRGGGPLAKLLVALAVMLMIAGVAIGVMFGTDADPQPAATTSAVAPAPVDGTGAPLDRPAGFLPDSRPGSWPPTDPGDGPLPPDATEAEPPPANMWSAAMFRLGFSFFIGFAIAFALRSFVKLSLVAVGFFALALFGMQYAGFIEVNWTLLGDRYDSAGGWLASQFSSFQDFIAGELPSAAGVLGGLALGFRSRL